MDSLISMFHLDTKLLLAQLINFTIVMLVLWFFAVKPLIKVMGERTAKIEKSLREAKEIEEKMAQTEAERQKVLDQTKKEALVLLEQSRKEAENQKQEIVKKTKEEVESIVLKGKEQLAAEKEKMIKEVKVEVGSLVVETTKKVLGGVLTKEVDKKVVEEAIKEIK